MLRKHHFEWGISSGCSLLTASSSPFQTTRNIFFIQLHTNFNLCSPDRWLQTTLCHKKYTVKVSAGLACAWAKVLFNIYNKTHNITVTFHFLRCLLSFPSPAKDLILNLRKEWFISLLQLWAPFSLAYLAIKQICFPTFIIYLHFFLYQAAISVYSQA